MRKGSPKDTNRPTFKGLLKDRKNGAISTVIVKKADRVSRSIIDLGRVCYFSESHCVNLVSLREKFDTITSRGRAVIRIVMVFAQFETEQTSDRTLDVLEHGAREGLRNGRSPPRRYDLNDGRLVVNPKDAKIPKTIFRKDLAFAPYRRVAEFLNSKIYKP